MSCIKNLVIVLVLSLAILTGPYSTFAQVQPIATKTPSTGDSQQTSSPSAQIIERVIVPTEPINLTLSPIALTLETEPGVPVNSQIKIRNNSNQAESLKISIGTFTADETGARPLLRDPRLEDTFIPWLTLEKERFIINPGEWETIPLTFSPPSDASLSYYYTIIISRAQSAKLNPGETAVEGAPALLVLTTVHSPHARRQLTLEDFSVKFPVVEYLPQEFTFKIKNTGNVHLAPNGNVFVDGPGKKDIAVLLLNPNSASILPDSEREYTVVWDDGFPNYTTDPKLPDNEQKPKLSWDFSKANRFRIGKYTAHVLMVYDDGVRDIPIETSISFWVIPWKIILGGLLVLLLVGVGVRSVILSVVKKVKK